MPSSPRRLVAVAVACAAGFLSSSVLAQGSGGSAGSSGFGSGGGGGGGGSSSSSSWGSSSSSSSSEPARPRSAADFSPPAAELGATHLAPRTAEIPEAESDVVMPPASSIAGTCACLAVFVLVFGGLGGLGWKLTKPKPGGARAASPGRAEIELRRVSIGFDWTARAELQKTLQTIAATPMGSDDGRRRVLTDMVHVLVEKLPAARYAAQQSMGKSWSEAEPAFLAMTSQLRSRYRADTKGQHALAVTPEFQARADEGQGLVVVSMVFCAVGALSPLPAQLDRESVQRALRGSLTPPTARIIAFEMIWSPAEENDRMSSAELENLYPELLRIDSGADVGRIQCGYCSAVFPAEIGNCPACGAPRPGAPAG